ncbi:MAG: hypothetical protein C0412_14785, partial [Flavobacterium sp.]|nr:hypothetical protein [Flavobacterium sp.]
EGFTQFSTDYQRLIQYVKSHPTEKRYVWFPMTFTGYTPIQDAKNLGVWYAGLSPLQIFTGQSDMVGFYGLTTPMNPTRQWELLELLRNKQYIEFIKVLSSYNIGYVIVDHQDPPQEISNASNQLSFMSLQTDQYKDVLLGEKIIDIGSSYSIYEIAPRFQHNTIFLTDSLDDIQGIKYSTNWKKIGINTFEIDIPKHEADIFLVLLKPYHSLWKINSTNRDNFIVGTQQIAYDYGNAWRLPKNNSSMTVRIFFSPDRLTKPAILVSVIALILAIIYITITSNNKKHL